jgi:hypothetical protein
LKAKKKKKKKGKKAHEMLLPGCWRNGALGKLQGESQGQGGDSGYRNTMMWPGQLLKELEEAHRCCWHGQEDKGGEDSSPSPGPVKGLVRALRNTVHTLISLPTRSTARHSFLM